MKTERGIDGYESTKNNGFGRQNGHFGVRHVVLASETVVSDAETVVSDAETIFLEAETDISESKRVAASKRSFRTPNGYENEGVRKSVSTPR